MSEIVGKLNAPQSLGGKVIPRGEDGISPVVETSEIEGGCRIEITDINGKKSIDLMHGEKGDKGDKGDPGSSIFYANHYVNYTEGSIGLYILAKTFIVTNGRTIQDGDLIVTSNGILCKVTSVSVSQVTCAPLADISGDKGDPGEVDYSRIKNADWAQDDVYAPDYVKNRTHYEDPIYLKWMTPFTLDFDGRDSYVLEGASLYESSFDSSKQYIARLGYNTAYVKCTYDKSTGGITANFISGALKIKFNTDGKLEVTDVKRAYNGSYMLIIEYKQGTRLQKIDPKFLPENIGANVLTVTLEDIDGFASHGPREIYNHVQNGGIVRMVYNTSVYQLAYCEGDGSAAGFFAYNANGDGVDLLEILDDATVNQKTLVDKHYVDNNAGGGSKDAVLYTPQTLTEAQKAQARKNLGVIGSNEVFTSIVELLKHAVYDTDMSDTLKELEEAILPKGDVAYKWVVGLNGSYVSGTNEAMLVQNAQDRAMCLAKDVGIPITYGANHAATEMSPYSPVVIPDGAVSVTVRCPGFRIAFNELKLVDGKWIRLFDSDTNPTADEVTYVFKSADASGLYVKLRHLTDDTGNLSDVPETVDITFNYEPAPEPVYEWINVNGSSISGTNEAMLVQGAQDRAMCLAKDVGIPITYGANHAATEMSPYSPVVIPDGAVSVTVRCPGFGISFHELKLDGGKWFRLYDNDTDAVADEVTYVFQSDLAKALYVKIRLMNNGEFFEMPENADITFNY